MTPGMEELEEAMSSCTGSPEQAAADEGLWAVVRRQFSVDPGVTHFNNAGHNPMPNCVADAVRREFDWANRNPVKAMQTIGPKIEVARRALAELFGCDPEEVALTRNCSESMEICQFGIDLRPGDEVLTTNAEYFRMLMTFRQRERRDGAVLKQFPIPVISEDPGALVALFEEHITPRTRMILMSHVIMMTGQIMPVREVVRMARSRGIPVVVDGAQSFGHLAFTHADLDCDFFGTSLHKWLKAPCGSGMLFVRRDRIRDVWPLMAAPEENDGDIRKFERIGTAPSTMPVGVAAAAAFYKTIGAERKEARLRYLRDRWATRLLRHERVELSTSLKREFSCGIGLIRIKGVDHDALSVYLAAEHNIVTSGLRISPNIYTSADEIDRFCEIMESVIRDGLPA
ncbi:MAG: aminotransferase class V-fold PLP-dependent enzyme [Planctomycetota bacterium]